MRRFIMRNVDWAVAVVIALAAIPAVYVLMYMNNGHRGGSSISGYDSGENTPLTPTDQYASKIFEQTTVDKNMPPPAKTQASYYRKYLVGDIYVEVQKLETNVSKVPELGDNVRSVILLNSLNSPVDLSADQAKSISIGCIGSVKNGAYSTTTPKPKAMHFDAYETKKIEVQTNTNCIYIGTADNEYFWTIY